MSELEYPPTASILVVPVSKADYRPLPVPEIIPPKIAHKSRSVPARGDAMLTSIGNISVISHATKE